jgi:hypothetical protein
MAVLVFAAAASETLVGGGETVGCAFDSDFGLVLSWGVFTSVAPFEVGLVVEEFIVCFVI